jgi:phosphatidylserine decarboxylase
MAQTLQEWLSTEVKQLQKMPVGELSNTFFFRDPIRPNFIDHEHFYSPADGTILYQKIY